jgi:hypothetical protein
MEHQHWILHRLQLRYFICVFLYDNEIGLHEFGFLIHHGCNKTLYLIVFYWGLNGNALEIFLIVLG